MSGMETARALPASVPMMLARVVPAIAAVVRAQKLLPPHPAVDVPLALAIIALGRRHRRNLNDKETPA